MEWGEDARAACRGNYEPGDFCQALPSLFLPLVLQNRFVYNGTLKDSHSYQNARFGSSIASVRDLNQDSYDDVVVGAPLEDNHAGAIYIFHGFRGSILKTPKQVRLPRGSRWSKWGCRSPRSFCASSGSGFSSVPSHRNGCQSVLVMLPHVEILKRAHFTFRTPHHHHPLWHPLPAYLYPPPTTNNSKSLAPDPHSSQDVHTCNCLPAEHLFWANSSLEALRARNRAHLKTDPSWVPSPEDHPFAPWFISKIV